MNELQVQGRWRPDADRDQIRRRRQEPPEWSRGQLSVPLAAQWRWRNAAGRRKYLAVRTRLVKLLARGLRTLPAYRLTTDLTTPAAILIQDYFDRWGSEVNHRDEQAILGVGDAPVWHVASVCKGPAVIVALYRWLLLAGRPCYGPTRTADYLPLPQWRPRPKRPSCQDLINRLRQPLTAPHAVRHRHGPAHRGQPGDHRRRLTRRAVARQKMSKLQCCVYAAETPAGKEDHR